MNQALTEDPLQASPFMIPADDESTGLLARLRVRLADAWKRHRYRKIQHAIKTYNAERHFLSPVFRPVVGPATIRMANHEIERNKLPFSVDHSRPWLTRKPLALRPPTQETLPSKDSENTRELPASLRQRQRHPEDQEDTPIILIT